MALEALEAIQTRRVVRSFRDEPVSEELIRQVLDAAKWAPAAHNMRFQYYFCLTDAHLIRHISLVSPGMRGQPPALIVICLDWAEVPTDIPGKRFNYLYIDLGIAVQNMLLAAHALDLGGWPIASFSQDAVSVLLNLPSGLRPEMFVGLGYPAKGQTQGTKRPKTSLRMEEFVTWGPYRGEDEQPGLDSAA